MPAAPPSNYLGNNILRARTSKGMTQLALGLAVGWTGTEAGAQIARYEAGKKQPMLVTLQKIAVALDVGIDELLLPTKK